MSPANFHCIHEQPRKVINGQRPSPLMIKRESHFIHKPSSLADTKPHQQQPRNPVIIYAHSPKVIHAKPRDFMGLVQRLTGMSPKARIPSTASLPPQSQHRATENFGSFSSDGSKSIKSIEQKQSVSEGNESNEEACDNESINGQLISPFYNVGLADLPLFTPNSSDFFCSSSRQVHKFSDSPFGNLAGLISPSGLEFLKELPEY